MLQQNFYITVESEDSAGLSGAMLAIRECCSLITEHVHRCNLDESDIDTILD